MRRYETGTVIKIKTKPFYIKYAGMVTLDKKALYQWESDKAILIRENVQTEERPMYCNTSMWIPKSKIISLEKVPINKNILTREEYESIKSYPISYEDYVKYAEELVK